MFIIIGLFWLILDFVLASAAQKKGRSFGGFLIIGLLLSPIIGFIILLAMGENKQEVEKQNISAGITKKCPFCANEIKKEAVVCQFCGKEIPKEKGEEITADSEAVKIVKSAFRLREMPSYENSKTTVLVNDREKITVLEESNGWSNVRTAANGEGWIPTDHLE